MPEKDGLRVGKPVPQASVEFIAMMEDLANAELRGAVLRLLPEGNEEQAWRNALGTLVRGFASGAADDATPGSPHADRSASTGARRAARSAG